MVLVRVGSVQRPTGGVLLTHGNRAGEEGPRAKATAWTGKVAGSQESVSRLEGHPAKRRAEDRTHGKGPKQRESVNDERQGEKIRAGGLQGFPRQSGDACGDGPACIYCPGHLKASW